MKAYNTPKDELLIKSDEGEELVKITPEKTTISNLEGGGSGDNIIFISAELTPPSTIVVEKNYDEVKELLDNGKQVYLVVKMGSSNHIFELHQYSSESIVFDDIIFSVDENDEPYKLIVSYVAVYLDNDNTATAYSAVPQYVELTSYM